MSENTPPSNDQPGNGFFFNQGTLSGSFTPPGFNGKDARRVRSSAGRRKPNPSPAHNRTSGAGHAQPQSFPTLTAYPPTERHGHGREARAFDIVETQINVGSYLRIPVIAQVVRVLPLAGRAEIAPVSRPSGMARRLPHMALQNIAARIIPCDLQPIEKLRLRSRASRPSPRISGPRFPAASPDKSPTAMGHFDPLKPGLDVLQMLMG